MIIMDEGNPRKKELVLEYYNSFKEGLTQIPT